MLITIATWLTKKRTQLPPTLSPGPQSLLSPWASDKYKHLSSKVSSPKPSVAAYTLNPNTQEEKAGKILRGLD